MGSNDEPLELQEPDYQRSKVMFSKQTHYSNEGEKKKEEKKKEDKKSEDSEDEEAAEIEINNSRSPVKKKSNLKKQL